MTELTGLAEVFFAKVGILGLAVLWALKAGAGWVALRWLRLRRRNAAG